MCTLLYCFKNEKIPLSQKKVLASLHVRCMLPDIIIHTNSSYVLQPNIYKKSLNMPFLHTIRRNESATMTIVAAKTITGLNANSLVVLQAGIEPLSVTAMLRHIFCHQLQGAIFLVYCGKVFLDVSQRLMYEIHNPSTYDEKYSAQGLSFKYYYFNSMV